jgi:hypothetical protein
MTPSIELRSARVQVWETKFLVPAAVGAQIQDWARARLEPDPHAGGIFGDTYRITSLFVDSPERDVFLRHGSYGRAKYRVRRYGEGDALFVERKLKARGHLIKRRTAVSSQDLERIEAGEAGPGSAGYWFCRRLIARRLEPVCQVSYLRMARVARTAYGPIRLTVDDGLCAMPASRLALMAKSGTPLCPGQMILELKYGQAMPVLFKQLVQQFRLEPQRLSKYRLAVAKLGLVPAPVSSMPPQACTLEYAYGTA